MRRVDKIRAALQQRIEQTASTSAESSERSSPTLTPAVSELLLRYELGEVRGRVRARLAEIFRGDPPDALDRLERAAAYLSIDGSGLEEAARRADASLDDPEEVAA